MLALYVEAIHIQQRKILDIMMVQNKQEPSSKSDTGAIKVANSH
jgi:hypothetical protein